MEIILFAVYLGLSFIAVQLIVFIKNTGELLELPSSIADSQEHISVLIPARNEEATIGRCLSSLADQHYQNFEIIVLDDNSTDSTPEILSNFQSYNPNINIKIVSGKQKPENWLGKNWACFQLASYAKGDIIVFIDADTAPEQRFLSAINYTIINNKLDALTVWPKQILGSFWEQVIIPQMYYVIYTLLPIKYTYSDPSWMPRFLIASFRDSFAAACGQCMVFRKNTYNIIGGHESVKSEVVEDVMLARLIRRNNFSYRMYHGLNTFSCRMYSSEAEIFQGFRKNFLAGFGNNFPFFTFSWVLHVAGYILPWFSLPYGVFSGNELISILSFLMIVIPIGIRIRMDHLNQWKTRYAMTHVLGVLWFNRLALKVVVDKMIGRKATWKGRSV